jgi:DNA modification methylase
MKNKHPTQKPIELFEYLIKTYSNENQVVLDCFAGSGTTAIACIETNRKYICFENNPQYFKIINDRIKSAKSQTQLSNESCPKGEFNIDLTATQQVATPKSATQTSLNPDIKSNQKLSPMEVRR